MVAALVTILVLPDLVFRPGEVILTGNGDAYKNYYTFLYHAQYGNGIWFEGMNYPYGENLFFADAMPVLSIPIGWSNAIDPLAVFHLFLALGFFLSIVFTAKVILRFNIHVFGAIFFAMLITMMSPQAYKLYGHFSLAWLCVLPMTFYYHLCYHQTGRSKYFVYLLVWSCVFALLHIYFAGMIALWMALYSAYYLVANRKQLKAALKFTAPLGVVALLPIILLKLILQFTDHTIDRPDYPYGALENRTHIEDIYSTTSPIWQWLQEHHIVKSIGGVNEGSAYIGLVALITLLSAIVVYFFKRGWNARTEQPLGVWIFIAFGMLVFATAIVFVKCFTCLDHASMVKQFRAIGRFTWAYYYIASVAAVIIIYNALEALQKKKPIYVQLVMVVVMVVWMSEAVFAAVRLKQLVHNGSMNYKAFIVNNATQKVLEDHGYSATNFQGILMLPYVHIGTEKLGNNAAHADKLNRAFSASLELGLPLVDVMMSRSGWQEAFGQVRISGGPYSDKPLLRNVPNNKPLLLMHPDSYALTEDEQHLLNASTYINTTDGYKLYAFYPKQLLGIEQAIKDSMLHAAASMRVGDSCIDHKGIWYAEHFNEGASTQVLFGSGAELPIEGVTKTIFNSSFIPANNGQQYEFSAWVLVPADNYKIPSFRICYYDEQEQLIDCYRAMTQEATDNKGLWIRANTFFTPPENCKRIAIEIINVIFPAYDALDELMVRPVGTTILSKDEQGRVMVNNHILSY